MKTYRIPATGDMMKVLQSSKGRKDGKFIIEVTPQPFADWAKVYHYHPNITETFKVLQGELSLKPIGISYLYS